MLVLFMYITRLASNEIFSPSNKIHREVGRAKDLPAPVLLIVPSGRLSLNQRATSISLVHGCFSTFLHTVGCILAACLLRSCSEFAVGFFAL